MALPQQHHFTIRRARPDESADLRSLMRVSKGHWGYDDVWLDRWMKLIDLSPDFLRHNEAYVAEVEGRLAGFYTVIPGCPVAVLDDLWLLPEYIGTGLGRRLFDHARARAVELGASTLELEAEAHAIGFYEHMGCRKVREVRTAMERTLPIMALELRPDGNA